MIEFIGIWFGFPLTRAEVGRQKTWRNGYLEGFSAGILWVAYFVKFEKVWPFKLICIGATIWKPDYGVVLEADVEAFEEIGYFNRSQPLNGHT
jgi:hypothetical protein